MQIHLFANGNGRHARFAADLYLEEYFSHPPIDWEGGHDLLHNNERRQSYIAALQAADGHDYEPLIAFVHDGSV